jgi:hypothetical protein
LHPERGDQPARAAPGSHHILNLGIADPLNGDAVVTDLRTLPLLLPKFALLAGAVSINEKGVNANARNRAGSGASA